MADDNDHKLSDGATRTDDASKAKASGDSPKPHGDPFAAARASAPPPVSAAQTGDTPKPHGDKLQNALNQVTKG